MRDKKRIIVLTILFIFMIICSVALCYTPKKYKEYVHTDDIITTISGEDIISQNDPESAVLAVNLSEVDNLTPYLVIKFKDDSAYGTYYDIYTYTSDDYSQIAGLYGAITYSHSGYGVITLDSVEDVYAIGIPYRIDPSIDCIEIHSNEPTFTYANSTLQIHRFIACIVMSILVTIGLFFLDCKKKYIDTALHAIYESRKKILKGFIIAVALAILAIILEFLFKTILIHFGVATGFRRPRFFFFWGVLGTCAWLFHMRKQFEAHTAKAFLGFIWIVGITIILVCPFAHAGWDIDSHYSLALTASQLGAKEQTLTDLYITTARGASLVKGDYAGNQGTIAQLNDSYTDIIDHCYDSISIAHVPAGVGIALGRLLGLSFYKIFMLGELMNLLVYSILCAIAINKLKSGKFILASIALFPTNVFMACCYNYDYWVLGFSFVGIAYFISAYQTLDEKITLKDELIMCFAIMIACIPKQIYLPMLILPFLLPKKKMVNRVKYYLTAMLPFVALAGLLLIRTLSEVNTTGDIRGGSGVNPVEQLHYILGNIPAYAKTLLDFMKDIFSLGYIEQAITNYGNIGYYLAGANLVIIMVIVVAVLDKKSCDIAVGNWLTRSFAIVFMVGEAALIATAFYMAYTAVGANYINGVQARYLTPMMYPLVAVMGSGRVDVKFNRNYLGYMVFGTEFVVLVLGICQAMLTKLI